MQYFVCITDANSCISKDSVFLTVNTTCGNTIFIPNIFSPNGDGINDDFITKTDNIKDFQFEIYDRRGLIVFETSSNNVYWNGKNKKGEVCSEDTYFYLLRAEKYTGEKRIIRVS